MLSTAGTTIVSAMGTVWNIVTGNPLLEVFVGASVLALGFRFFHKAKSAARG